MLQGAGPNGLSGPHSEPLPGSASVFAPAARSGSSCPGTPDPRGRSGRSPLVHRPVGVDVLRRDRACRRRPRTCRRARRRLDGEAVSAVTRRRLTTIGNPWVSPRAANRSRRSAPGPARGPRDARHRVGERRGSSGDGRHPRRQPLLPRPLGHRGERRPRRAALGPVERGSGDDEHPPVQTTARPRSRRSTRLTHAPGRLRQASQTDAAKPSGIAMSQSTWAGAPSWRRCARIPAPDSEGEPGVVQRRVEERRGRVTEPPQVAVEGRPMEQREPGCRRRGQP